MEKNCTRSNCWLFRFNLGSVAGGSESLDNATLLAIDNNLGTGNHTYTVYTRKASGNPTYASNVYDNYRTSQIVVWGYWYGIR